MTDTSSIEARLEQMRRMRDTQSRKAAQANRECERLRAEIRKLRQQNFTLQRYADNPGSQAGYRRRYEELHEAVLMVRDILNPTLNGLPPEQPTTLEPPYPPDWARVKFVPRPGDKR